jgi:predicted nucleic acid-binding protein
MSSSPRRCAVRATGSRANLAVRELVQERPHEIALAEPVVMELLAGAGAGAGTERAFALIEKLTSGLPLLSVDVVLGHRDAAVAYRAVRAGGGTVRKLLGCLIAVVAMRTGAVLVHRDRDFDVLSTAHETPADGPSGRGPQHRVHHGAELVPVGALPGESVSPSAGEGVGAPFPAADGAPGAREQRRPLEPPERGIDRAGRQVECATAARLQRLDDRVAVPWPVLEHRQDQAVEMATHGIRLHR